MQKNGENVNIDISHHLNALCVKKPDYKCQAQVIVDSCWDEGRSSIKPKLTVDESKSFFISLAMDAFGRCQNSDFILGIWMLLDGYNKEFKTLKSRRELYLKNEERYMPDVAPKPLFSQLAPETQISRINALHARESEECKEINDFFNQIDNINNYIQKASHAYLSDVSAPNADRVIYPIPAYMITSQQNHDAEAIQPNRSDDSTNNAEALDGSEDGKRIINETELPESKEQESEAPLTDLLSAPTEEHIKSPSHKRPSGQRKRQPTNNKRNIYIDADALVGITNVQMTGWFFVRDEDILENMHEDIAKQLIIQIIYGDHGAGKTRLASEYIYSYHKEYSTICWINAFDLVRARNDILTFFRMAGIECESIEQDEVTKLFNDYFTVCSNWLIILDNLNPSVVKTSEFLNLIPTKLDGHILITCENKDCLFDENGLFSSTLFNNYSCVYLESSTGIGGALADPLDDGAKKEELWYLLDWSPVAMSLAKWYINQNRLSKLQQYVDVILHYNSGYFAPDDIPNIAFDIALNQIRIMKKYKDELFYSAIEQAVALSIFFTTCTIDLNYLLNQFPILPHPLIDICSDNERRSELVDFLRWFGFVEIRDSVLIPNTLTRQAAIKYFSTHFLEDLFWKLYNAMEETINNIRNSVYIEEPSRVLIYTMPYAKDLYENGVALKLVSKSDFFLYDKFGFDYNNDRILNSHELEEAREFENSLQSWQGY